MALIAFVTNLPRFLDFKTTKVIVSGNSSLLDIQTTALNEDARYIVFNSYFELLTTGILPLVALCYYNYIIYRSAKEHNTVVYFCWDNLTDLSFIN